ncbi:hypothetical protein PAMA_008068 [Pampus argenteus]
MRQSLMSIVFAASLLFECYSLSVALPMAKTEDSSLEQDAFASLLSDEGTENSLADADLATAGKSRGPKVIVVADPSLWRDMRVLHNGLSFHKRRADDNSQVIEHREAGQDLNIPILRRNTMSVFAAMLRAELPRNETEADQREDGNTSHAENTHGLFLVLLNFD